MLTSNFLYSALRVRSMYLLMNIVFAGKCTLNRIQGREIFDWNINLISFILFSIRRTINIGNVID